MLKLAKPVLLDADKMRKIDWTNYLHTAESTSVYPVDMTKLVSRDVFASIAGSGSVASARDETQHTVSFATQSFFWCWRALHLGIVHMCDKYYEGLLHLSRFGSGKWFSFCETLHGGKLYPGCCNTLSNLATAVDTSMQQRLVVSVMTFKLCVVVCLYSVPHSVLV
jgi:hypothetical protein